MTDLIWLTNWALREDLGFDSVFNLIIGRPKATDTYSVRELEAMGMCGIYRRADDPSGTRKENA